MRRPWTTAEQRRLVELYRAGLSFQRIGAELDWSERTVRQRVVELRRQGVCVGLRRLSRPWTATEDGRLRDLYAAVARRELPLTVAGIAKLMCRSRNAVALRATVLRKMEIDLPRLRRRNGTSDRPLP